MKKYLIESIHLVFEDSYKEGELSFINEYTLQAFIEHETQEQAINKYIKEHIFVKDISFSKEFVNDNRFDFSFLCDKDNSEPSEKELDEWRKNKIRLYCNSVSIKISEINECKINEED
jgi:hypothetical protein